MLEFGYTDSENTPDSTFCQQICYNKDEKKVLFRLNGGKFLVYGDIPEDVWDSLTLSDSVGRFYQSEIRGKYTPLASDRDDIDTLKVFEVKDEEVFDSPALTSVFADRLPGGSSPYANGGTISAPAISFNQNQKDVRRQYVVTAAFDNFEDAALFASYAAPKADSLALDSYDKEV